MWLSQRWQVTAEPSAVVSNIPSSTVVERYLNLHYNESSFVGDVASSSGLAVIPKSILTIGTTYVFSLTVVNFFGNSGVGALKVMTTLGNISTVVVNNQPHSVVYRWQPTTIYATASASPCFGSSSSLPLIFKWKVYKGKAYQSDVKSVSLDPSYFTVPSYTLEASSVYTFEVAVATASPQNQIARAPLVSSATVSVIVGRSGIVALLSGGSEQTFGISTTNVLSAQGSYDMDYPSSSLIYQWSCKHIWPNFGMPCVGSTSWTRNGSMWIIPPNGMVEGTYNMTVVVSNIAGLSDVASCVVTAVSTDVARISLSLSLIHI